MFQIILQEKKIYLILLFWVLIGMFTGPLAYLIIPVHLIILNQKGEWLVILLGLWLILTLSDSRQHILQFTQSLKPLLMALLGFLILISSKRKNDWAFFNPFILFFGIAFLAWLNSPIAFDSMSKMISYALLLLVIPWMINELLNENRDRLLSHLIILGTVVLAIGVVLRFVLPFFVIFLGNRYSGLLGNPNGMGIYGFLFLALVTIILTYHPHLFKRYEKIAIYAVILLSMVWAASRGGLFASALFLLGWYLFRKNTLIGFIVMGSIFISYQLVIANFEEIVTSLGLQHYFRLETFQSGAGRLVASKFAWKHIETQFWLGKGFGYTDYLMKLHARDFLQLGHQGNVHNSYLTMWLDTGLVGLIAFCFGWLKNFFRAARNSPLVWALFFGLLLSTFVESWLSASLNPYTIQLVIILSLLSNPEFYRREEDVEEKVD